MQKRNKAVVTSSLVPVPEIPSSVMNHIQYVAAQMIGKSNLHQCDYDDLVQDLSIAVIKAVDNFNSDLGRMTTYLNLVVDRTSKNIYRKRISAGLDIPSVPISNSEDEDEWHYAECVSDDLERNILCADVRTVVATLPQLHQQICLSLMDGYSIDKTARRLAMAASTLRDMLPEIRAVFIRAEIIF